MGNDQWGVTPLEPVLVEIEAGQHRRSSRERVERAEEVVDETGLDQLSRTDGTPGLDAASTTCTDQPWSASRLAATSPFGPDPMTTASGCIATAIVG